MTTATPTRNEYVTLDFFRPSRHGLRHAIERTCTDCADWTGSGLRYEGDAEDQSSPCMCCGRGPDDTSRPTCHHDGWWEIFREFGLA